MLFCVSCTKRICCFRSNQSVNKRRRRIRAADTEQRTLLASSGYSPKWCNADAEETNCWIKSLFLFFAYKNYSRSFITLRLNHWWQMDYSDDVSHTFLGLDSANCLAVNGTVTSLLVFIQNILNCVLKTNEAFTGLEQHGGKWLMTQFHFGVE